MFDKNEVIFSVSGEKTHTQVKLQNVECTKYSMDNQHLREEIKVLRSLIEYLGKIIIDKKEIIHLLYKPKTKENSSFRQNIQRNAPSNEKFNSSQQELKGNNNEETQMGIRIMKESTPHEQKNGKQFTLEQVS